MLDARLFTPLPADQRRRIAGVLARDPTLEAPSAVREKQRRESHRGASGGYLPGKVVNIMQCTGDVTGGAAACNISGGQYLYPDPGQPRVRYPHWPHWQRSMRQRQIPAPSSSTTRGLSDEEAIIRIPITLAD